MAFLKNILAALAGASLIASNSATPVNGTVSARDDSLACFPNTLPAYTDTTGVGWAIFNYCKSVGNPGTTIVQDQAVAQEFAIDGGSVRLSVQDPFCQSFVVVDPSCTEYFNSIADGCNGYGGTYNFYDCGHYMIEYTPN